MIVLSAMSTITTMMITKTKMAALTTILPEMLSLPSPPKKTCKTSHQCQVDRQNEQKAKETYAQAFARATMLIATERGEEKENA